MTAIQFNGKQYLNANWSYAFSNTRIKITLATGAVLYFRNEGKVPQAVTL